LITGFRRPDENTILWVPLQDLPFASNAGSPSMLN
jgi:hypothetical protein